jgi:ribosomal protein L3 glutamine methyltransferase
MISRFINKVLSLNKQNKTILYSSIITRNNTTKKINNKNNIKQDIYNTNNWSNEVLENICKDLNTISDFHRFTFSTFLNSKSLTYGQGSVEASDDSSLLVLQSLNLPLRGSVPISQLIEKEIEKNNYKPKNLKSLNHYFKSEIDLGIIEYGSTNLTFNEKLIILNRIKERINNNVPVAYLVNAVYQQGYLFHVDERVLIPRSFIGEILANIIFEKHNKINFETDEPEIFDPFNFENVESVLDLCTGSGCLPILAMKFLPNVKSVDAVDISHDAIEVANINIKTHKLNDKIKVYNGDLFKPLKEEKIDKKYDLIISNPPYVTSKDMMILPQEYKHEPSLALDAGVNGLDIIEKIIKQAPLYLTSKGGLLLEIGKNAPIIKKKYPLSIEGLEWIDTEISSEEVFYATKKQLIEIFSQKISK